MANSTFQNHFFFSLFHLAFLALYLNLPNTSTQKNSYTTPPKLSNYPSQSRNLRNSPKTYSDSADLWKGAKFTIQPISFSKHSISGCFHSPGLISSPKAPKWTPLHGGTIHVGQILRNGHFLELPLTLEKIKNHYFLISYHLDLSLKPYQTLINNPLSTKQPYSTPHAPYPSRKPHLHWWKPHEDPFEIRYKIYLFILFINYIPLLSPPQTHSLLWFSTPFTLGDSSMILPPWMDGIETYSDDSLFINEKSKWKN